MKSSRNRLNIMKRILIILPIVIFTIMLAHGIYLIRFNHKLNVIKGADSSKLSYMFIGGRADSTNEWKKRDFLLGDETVDLTGRTFDGTMYNNAFYAVKEWRLIFHIHGDCYINQAWNGVVEIHQFVDGEERSQLLNLSNYKESDITLKWQKDNGDLLIPLTEGDYFIYYPSESFHENNIDKNFKTTMGFILYYLEMPDMTDYEVELYYDRKHGDDFLFYVIVALYIIWATLLLIFITASISYRNAEKALEMKKSGILSLSEVYAIIYMIDIEDDELTPIFADEKSESLRPKDMTAREQLLNMCTFDCEEPYMELAKEFCETKTLVKRLEKKNTIVLEYKSKHFGWCEIRFFAMDRKEGQPLSKALFTIRVINDEKEELEEISNRVEMAELESKAKSTFLANMSHEIRTPINTVIGLDTMILRESNEPAIKNYAKDIKSAADMLLELINSILDFSKLEANKMELVNEEYSFKKMIVDVRNMVKSRVEFEHLSLDFEVSPSLPDHLIGDNVRLKQVLINLLTNAAKYTEEGSVKLSVFGKKTENKVHLLISVKDTGIGIKEEDLAKLTERFSRLDEKRNHNIEGTGIGLNLVLGILELMNSELHVISKYNEGSEFYFEIEQDVVDDELIGDIDYSITEEEDEYNASFTAKDAKILVVDDNAMNLTVFGNLLKETEVQIDKVLSGKMALRKTMSEKYDLIFMDHMMPEMDGVETFKRIREQSGGKNQDTPIIILTANALKGAAEEYRRIGFNDFLSKPIQPEILEAKIVEFLDASKVKLNVSKKPKKTADTVTISIEGIDVTHGLTRSGGMDSLLSMLKQFVSLADTDANELHSYFAMLQSQNDNTEAIQNYRIKVHAMKSSANVIGGLAVSGVAQMLEYAAIGGDVPEILSVTPHFLKEWNKLAENIRAFLLENEPKKELNDSIDYDKLTEILHQLVSVMKEYDVKNADAIMEKLNGYNWDANSRSVVDKLQNAISMLDAESIPLICDELLNVMKQ